MPNNVVGFKINGSTYKYDHNELENLPEIDSTPTTGSNNAIKSGGVKAALEALQAQIPVVDPAPTQGSANAVSSGGVYSALEDKADKDSTPETVTPTETDADFYLSDVNGNVLLELADGHIKTKEFDSSDINTETDTTLSVQGKPADAKAVGDAIADVEEAIPDVSKLPEGKLTTAQNIDLDVTDTNGNVILRLADGHIRTKNFDSSRSDQNAVLTVNNTAPDANGNVNVRAELDPEDIAPAVEDYLDEHPVVASGGGVVSVADYGAVGDGITDDSLAIQNAVNSNNDVYFESDKTYYLGSTITINHDIKLHGGKNTVIKTTMPENAAPYIGIEIVGTLKTTTTLTSDYLAEGTGNTDNISNRFTLADMSNVEVGDIIIVTATDQYFSYSRRYYYLGGVLQVTDIYDGHIYTNRNMPWDITLTNSVSVKVYSAPSAVIENLTFVGDLDVFGSAYYNSYAGLLHLSKCKNSIVKNCDFNHMKIGLKIEHSVNVSCLNIELSKSRWENTEGMGDGYGIDIVSCTHTVISDVVALCAEDCIDLDGTFPNIDTYVYRCDLGSECRAIGFSMHDNAYNTVLEDCVLGGASLFGNCKVDRCQFFRNARTNGYGGVTFRGFADAKWANLHMTNCVFPIDASCTISFRPQAPQDYVQSSDSLFGEILIEDCIGGAIQYEVTTSEYTLSNVIDRLVLRNCKNMKEIYHKGGIIKNLVIEDCTFINPYYLNKHTDAINTDDIYHTVVRNTFPHKDMLLVNSQGYGEQFVLPDGIDISVSSSDASADYVVCGKNLASDDNADYSVGGISGSVGGALTRTPDTTATAFLSSDGSGNLVYTVPSGYTTSKNIFPRYLICPNAEESIRLNVSMKVKNTGATEGSSFRLYIAIIDCETGNITYNNHSSVYGQATAEGLTLSHTRAIPKGHAGFWYVKCYTTITGSETTIENAMVSLVPYDKTAPSYVPYNGSRRTGDGVLASVAGQNNIMGTVNDFNVAFECDYAEHRF